MSNVNLDILLNIVKCKNNYNSNLESIQEKIPINSLLKSFKNISPKKYMRQSLTKFHRPSTTKIKSHSSKKSKKNHKNNDFMRAVPIVYNANANKENNNSSDIHLKNYEYTYNLLDSVKINFYKKINGKNSDDMIMKNNIPLPEIREQNNFIKKSISIINQSNERALNLNNTKNQFFLHTNNQNQNLKNNIKVYNNNNINMKSAHKKQKNNNRYYQEENNNEKKENSNYNKLYDNKKSIFKMIGENSCDTNINMILLKSLEKKLKREHNPLYNSIHASKKSPNESKINKINNNNIFKFNDPRIQNDNNGLNNLIITNQKMMPEKNSIYNYQRNIYDSNDNLIHTKINNDKNNYIKSGILQKHYTIEKQMKEKDLMKFPNFKCFYYLILPGNASYLVQNCMKHRINWIKPFSIVSSLYNFKWQELSYGIDYNSLGCFPNTKQLVNHFENHFVISNKAKMFINLLNYCEKRSISVFKYVPFTIIFSLKDENEPNKDQKKNITEKSNKYENLKEIINSIDKYVLNYKDIGNFYKNEDYQSYISYLKSRERRGDSKNINYNDFKKLSKRKKKLFKKYKKRNGLNNIKKRDSEIEKENKDKISGYTLYSDYFNNLIEENSVPIYDKNKEKLYEEINNKFGNNNDDKNIVGTNTCIEIPNTHFSGKNMWIVKAINLNRGMCMKIVNSYEQMIKVINKFKEGVDYNFTKEKLDENNNEIKLDNKSEMHLNKSASKKCFNTKMSRKNLNSADKTRTIMINKDIIINKNKIKLVDKNSSNSSNKNIIIKTSTDDNLNIEKKKSKLEEEKKVNDLKEKEKLYNCNRIIIQKYIENPLLYKGRKFDIRIWVLLTHTMKVYIFKEGHLKTCSIEYNLNSKDAYAHITNYSFQKYNTNFQKYEKGNEVPFFEFQNFLNENYPKLNYSIKNNLVPQMKEIIKLTMKSIKYKINKNRRNYQFEIFGYDFMIDSEFNLFLIEINTNPGLEESSPWIKIVVPRMLDDALRITIDQLFETKYDFDLITKNNIKNDNNIYNNILNRYNQIIKDNDDKSNKENVIKNTKEDENKSYSQRNIEQSESKKDENIILNNKIKNKDIDNKQKKYISPFPVPGYSLDDNIWDFVCDLDDPDPLDELFHKEKENFNDDGTINSGYKHYSSKKMKKEKKTN